MLTLAGCTTHYDYMIVLHVEGQLIEGQSGAAVQGVKVFFIDTGFNPAPPKERRSGQIGQSDERGKLDLKYGYMWGADSSIFQVMPAQTFILEFKHPVYQSLSLPLRATDFPTEGNKVQVNLGIVKLTAHDPVAGQR